MGARVLYLTQTFPPEPGSTIRPLEQAQELIAAGHDVTVVTAFANYPTGRLAPEDRGRLWRRDSIDGVDVLRVATITAPARGRARRIASYLSYAAAAAVAGGAVRRPDVVIASVPHMFADLGGLAAARLRGAKLLLELRDLVPETTVHAGVDPRSPGYRALARVCRGVRRRVDAIAVPVTSLRDLLVARGECAPEDVLLVPHGVGRARREAADRTSGRRRLAAGARPVALYAGSFARGYGVPDLARAARGAPGVLWVLVGAGAEREEVAALAAGADNVRLLDPCDPRAVGDLIAASDLVLSPHATADSMPYLPVPMTKLTEALALGRPVLARETRSSAGPWLEEHAAGWGMRWGSAQDVGARVAGILGDREALAGRTRGARALGVQFYREHTVRPLLDWLER